MRHTSSLLTAIIGLALAAGAATAQGPPEGTGRRGGPPGGPTGDGNEMMQRPLMKALNTDGDGALSKTEIGKAVAPLKKLDTNGNDKLGQGELMPRHAGGPG